MHPPDSRMLPKLEVWLSEGVSAIVSGATPGCFFPYVGVWFSKSQRLKENLRFGTLNPRA